MRLWPFGVEKRESATDAIISALVSQASGSSSPPSAGDLAAVEAAAGLWSRAFASATVEPTTATTSALTPGILAAMGRGLAVQWRRGFRHRCTGRVATYPGCRAGKSGAVLGPETWTYQAEFPTPGGVRKRNFAGRVRDSSALCNQTSQTLARRFSAGYGL